MKTCAIVGFAVMALQSTSAWAQARVFDACDKPVHTIVRFGETLENRCKFVLVLNSEKVASISAKNETVDQLLTAFEQRRALTDEILKQQGEAIASYQRIERVQNDSYQELAKRFDAVDRRAVEANDNTKSALRLVKGIRTASYVTSGLLGAGSGAVVGGRAGDGTAPLVIGAVIGTLAGVALNHGVFKLVGLQ